MTVSNHLVDVVAQGADAGIRWGGTVPEDMVAQRLLGDIRWVVAGARACLDRHGTPLHPRDLSEHQCLRLRLGDDSIYHWEFDRDGEEIAIDVPGAITLDETQLALTLAAAGINKSVFPDCIVCLEDGKKLKMLKRHLQTRYGLSPDAYRAKWGLPRDYPMVAPNYAVTRSGLAKQIGLGRKPASASAPSPGPEVQKLPARRARGAKA